MTKKTVPISVTIVLMIISFAFGARIGVSSFLGSDARFQASIATYKLKNLSLENCKEDLEFERDRQLLVYGNNENNILNVFWPELNFTENSKRALSHAASYRKANPVEYISQKALESMSEQDRTRITNDIKTIDRVTNENSK